MAVPGVSHLSGRRQVPVIARQGRGAGQSHTPKWRRKRALAPSQVSCPAAGVCRALAASGCSHMSCSAGAVQQSSDKPGACALADRHLVRKGGQGSVYRSTYKGKEVAVKVIPRDKNSTIEAELGAVRELPPTALPRLLPLQKPARASAPGRRAEGRRAC